MFRIGEIGQWVGMAVSIAGLVYEAIAKADIGYIIMSGGSVAWAIFTKVKYYRIIKGDRNATRNRLR